jgi:hypothetical protein
MRFRLAAVWAAACLLVSLPCVRQAMAAAEVHRFNVVIAGVPTQVLGGDFNDQIDTYNKLVLNPRGYQTLDHVQFTWAYDAEARYFLRQNIALVAGVSQMRAEQKADFLPSITQTVSVRAEILTVPIHLGAMYYLQAYNQGDFQARAYMGGGLVQYAYTRATFQQNISTLDTLWNAPGHRDYGSYYSTTYTQDAPGYYLEGGAHMFFAARYSVIIAGQWRSGKMNNMRLDRVSRNGVDLPGESPGAVVTNSKGKPYQLDLGGLALKLAVAIGL